jgi:hypothetical protein
MQLKLLEEQEAKPQISRQKKINTRAEINEIETKQNKTKDQ